MDQVVINWAVGAVGLLMGAMMKAMWDSIRDLQKSQAALQKEIADNCVRRDDFAPFAIEIRGALQRIYDKLDGKADRE